VKKGIGNMWIFYRIIDFFKYLPKEIKWFCQRGIRGYSDYDTWDMDYWFLNTVVPMLKSLRKNKHGYPGNITQEEWDNILDKMIFYFTEANEETCSKQNKYKDSFSNVMWKNGKMIDKSQMNKQEAKYYEEIRHKYFNREKELDLYRNKKLQQGFVLFNNWFWHLWD
jgi:hypothetical protein